MTSHLLLSIVPAVALVACTAGPPRDSSPASPDASPDEAGEAACETAGGARLKLAIRDGDDGSHQVLGLYDSTHEARCAFARAGDGELRCLPDPDTGTVARTGIIMYTDAACSSAPLGALLGGRGQASMLRTGQGLGCGRLTRLYELGDPVELGADATAYFRDAQGACVASGATAAYSFVELGAEIPPEQFVAGSARWTDTDRVSMRIIDADDGSTVCDTETLRDEELDHPCVLRGGELGAFRCLPALSVDGFHTSPTCDDAATPGALVQACDGGASMATERIDACAAYRVRQLGGYIAGAVSWDRHGLCTAIDAPGGSPREAGAEVSLDSFAEFALRFTASGHRLEPGELVSGGLAVPRPLFRDAELDVTCAFRSATDGAVRCLPAVSPDVAQVRRLYSDANCTIPVEVAVGGLCPVGAPRYGLRWVDGAWAVHEIAGVSGPLFTLASGACAPAGADRTYYAIAATVPPAMFVRGTERVE